MILLVTRFFLPPSIWLSSILSTIDIWEVYFREAVKFLIVKLFSDLLLRRILGFAIFSCGLTLLSLNILWLYWNDLGCFLVSLLVYEFSNQVSCFLWLLYSIWFQLLNCLARMDSRRYTVLVSESEKFFLIILGDHRTSTTLCVFGHIDLMSDWNVHNFESFTCYRHFWGR